MISRCNDFFKSCDKQVTPHTKTLCMCVGFLFSSVTTKKKKKHNLASVKKSGNFVHTNFLILQPCSHLLNFSSNKKRQLKELLITGYAREIRWPDEGSLSRNKGVCYLTKKM